MILLSVLLAANISHAEVSVQAQNECKGRQVQQDKDVPADVKKAIYEQCLKVAEYRESVERVNAEIRATTSQANLQKCIDEERGGGWFGIGRKDITDGMIDKCRATVAAAKTRLDQQKARLEAAQRDMKTKEEEMVRAARSATADASAARGIAAVVGDEFKNMRMSILELLRQADQGEAQLNKLTQAIDNSALGVYLRDRVMKTLNSDVMCQMIKEQKCPIAKPADINKIFDSKRSVKATDVPRTTAPAQPATGTGSSNR